VGAFIETELALVVIVVRLISGRGLQQKLTLMKKHKNPKILLHFYERMHLKQNCLLVANIFR
jgi:hypothetical protein